MQDEHTKLLLRGIESKDLDYKGPMLWDEGDKKTCCNLVKDILAMANTSGGWIIIGISESPNGFRLEGLNDQQIKSFESTRLNNFVQNYADPPINVTLNKFPYDGKLFVLLGIPLFKDTPHICQKDFEKILRNGTIYVRSDNNETTIIKNSSDMRGLIDHAIRNRSDALLASIRSVLQGASITPQTSHRDEFESQYIDAVSCFESKNPFKGKHYEAYREIACFPAIFDNGRFPLEDLKRAAIDASITLVYSPFLEVNKNTYAIQDGLEHIYQGDPDHNYEELEFWRLQKSGFLFQRTLMAEEPWGRLNQKQSIMDPTWMARYIAEGLICATNVYTSLNIGEEGLTIRFTVLGTQDRTLDWSEQGRHLSMPYACKIPEIPIEHTYPLVEWRASLLDISLEIWRDIMLRFNWDNPSVGVARKDIENLVNRVVN